MPPILTVMSRENRSPGACSHYARRGWARSPARPGILSSVIVRQELALLWQNLFAPVFFKNLLSAIWALLRRRPKDEIDDGVTYGGHGWLRRRSVDSFFSAPRVRGDDVAGRRRQSLSSGRGDEDLAMIAPRSDQVRAPPSTADAPAHKSILP